MGANASDTAGPTGRPGDRPTGTTGQLSGMTAVVTGGSDGIGLAMARRFAENGADVIVVARDAERLARARRSLAAHGTAVHTIGADLALPDAPATVADQVLAITDAVHVLVNNPGASLFASLADTTPEDAAPLWQLNVAAPLFLTRALLPALRAARGSVITTTSYWASKMVAGRPSALYSATRGAQESMTRALANELGPDGIRVNAIAPGAVRTGTYERAHLDPMSPEQRRAHDEHVQRAYPLGRIGEADDVADAALYLASPGAAWVTGTVLRVDGGMSVR